MAIKRTDALLAARAGGEAFRDGKTIADCPHQGTDVPTDYLAFHWRRGFRAAESDA